MSPTDARRLIVRPSTGRERAVTECEHHHIEEQLDLRYGPVPSWVARREVHLAAGVTLSAEEEPWREELVTVEQGSIDVIERCGRVVHVATGAVLTLDGVPFAAVRCTSAEPAILVAVRRRPRPSCPP